LKTPNKLAAVESAFLKSIEDDEIRDMYKSAEGWRR
jgi:hypothetical protein